MKGIPANTGYFFREAFTLLRLNRFSNGVSLLSIGLVFFLLAMVIAGWWTSRHLIDVVQNEAEINVFYEPSLGQQDISQLVNRIKGIEGVKDSRLVSQDEAYNRMKTILGEEANILKLFNDNPFSPFLEVNVTLEKSDSVTDALSSVPGVQYIRNNKEVLDRIRTLSGLLERFGILVVATVGISTLILISHIIRQGIYAQREEIETLRLLGAPEFFISLPFVLEGLLLTLGGGLLSVFLTVLLLMQAYAQIPSGLSFLPLLPSDYLIFNTVIAIVSLSAILGVFGSILGLKQAKA